MKMSTFTKCTAGFTWPRKMVCPKSLFHLSSHLPIINWTSRDTSSMTIAQFLQWLSGALLIALTNRPEITTTSGGEYIYAYVIYIYTKYMHIIYIHCDTNTMSLPVMTETIKHKPRKLDVATIRKPTDFSVTKHDRQGCYVSFTVWDRWII